MHGLVDRALAELAASRAREGEKLDGVLGRDAPTSRRRSRAWRRAFPAIHAAYIEKLGARLREAGLDANEDRMKQELALFATKVDVAEEVARLSTHVAEVRRVLRPAAARASASISSRRSCTARRTRWAANRSMRSCRRPRSSSRC